MCNKLHMQTLNLGVRILTGYFIFLVLCHYWVHYISGLVPLLGTLYFWSCAITGYTIFLVLCHYWVHYISGLVPLLGTLYFWSCAITGYTIFLVLCQTKSMITEVRLILTSCPTLVQINKKLYHYGTVIEKS